MGTACSMQNNVVQTVAFPAPQNKDQAIIWALDKREPSQYLQNASLTFIQN